MVEQAMHQATGSPYVWSSEGKAQELFGTTSWPGMPVPRLLTTCLLLDRPRKDNNDNNKDNNDNNNAITCALRPPGQSWMAWTNPAVCRQLPIRIRRANLRPSNCLGPRLSAIKDFGDAWTFISTF
jgi:hypothetical protein